MGKIFFTADLHFGHTNILKHQPNRPGGAEGDTAKHDTWLLDLWQSTVSRQDTVYILGDLTFLKSDEARRLLIKLPGKKYMVEGNHDGSIRAYTNYFIRYEQILEARIKPTGYPAIPEPLVLVMCHYPMVTWNRKPHGSIMLHGHCHGKMDDFNAASTDLRFDVGIDGILAKKCGGFVPLESVYEVAKEKVGNLSFEEYALKAYDDSVR